MRYDEVLCMISAKVPLGFYCCKNIFELQKLLASFYIYVASICRCRLFCSWRPVDVDVDVARLHVCNFNVVCGGSSPIV